MCFVVLSTSIPIDLQPKKSIFYGRQIEDTIYRLMNKVSDVHKMMIDDRMPCTYLESIARRTIKDVSFICMFSICCNMQP